MIEPGNMRERPRDLDLHQIILRVVDDSVKMCTESIGLQSAALRLLDNSLLTEGAAVEILDRLAITRAQLDIITRILTNATGHEIHDSH